MDAEVVGSGPNGLAAAVVLARAGLKVKVYESASSAGGSARSVSGALGDRVITDVGSAVHPMAVASPFFKAFQLDSRIDLITPDVSYAHPMDDGLAGVAFRSLDRTVARLGADGTEWRRTFEPLIRKIEELSSATSGTLFDVATRPGIAWALGTRLAGQLSRNGQSAGTTSAMFAGLAAHSIARLPSIGGASVGLVLGAHAHAAGWPIPRGGSQSITNAMIRDLVSHGGSVEIDHRIDTADELTAPIKLFDLSPRALAQVGGGLLPDWYRRKLRKFQYGGAASKVDFLLSGPVPWGDPELANAGTVHVGGTWAEIADGERRLQRGELVDRPYVMVSQPSSFDESRAPAGHHVLWTYTHVPNGSSRDMTEAITRQIERFAPGFRDLVIGSIATPATLIAARNANHVGGDIATGAVSLGQLLGRPSISLAPWRTPVRGAYICSASSSPGPGVHGMAGFRAAQLALRDMHGITETPNLGLS